MTANKVYPREEAERILNEFPQAKLDELLGLAEQAERSKEALQIVYRQKHIDLPEGWRYEINGNCIVARYLDGEQGRQAFFVPQIWINYVRYVNETNPRVTKSIFERLPLGFCGCGKPMRYVQLLIKAMDMIELKGLRHLPIKVCGCALGMLLLVWLRVRPIHQYSLLFNRH
ncbi:MAG: hypothetical protein Q7S28_04205, partial [bacterium]|nr:hypothetical protein [bacterium]